MFWKKRKWVEVNRFFTPPRYGVSATSITTEEINKISFGFTTIEMRDELSGELKHIVVIGDLTKG